MAIKVIRYKHYGKFKGEYIQRYENLNMYWSFYELSNGNIIEFYLREQWWRDEFVKIDQEYTCALTLSKSGKVIREYKFGMDISDWVSVGLEDSDIRPANIEEVRCINNFFYRHVYEKREQESDVVVVSNEMIFNLNKVTWN